ncbi:MAG: serine/threonine protein kinase [Deltaproteobacteria bacterium]|nr:serine/threonine protein kinase [Deltaproteobacteria bacterium]
MADGKPRNGNLSAGKEVIEHDLEVYAPRLAEFEIERVMSDHAGITSAEAVRPGLSGYRKRLLLKSANEPVSTAPEANQRIVEEARIGMRVSHPNLVQVMDLGRDEGRMFLLREWVVGTGLRPLLARTWAARRSVPPAASLRIGVCVARALDYLHGLRGEVWAKNGVPHRVVAPSNILVSRAGEVRLTNLSRAELNARFDSEGRQVDDGFPAFAAPEVIQGQRPSHAADVFGLGAVLYESLGGSDSLLGTPASDWTRTRRALDLQAEVAASDLPRRLRHLLAAATSSVPEKRPTAQDLKSELRRWMFDELDTDGEDELRRAVSNIGPV